MTRDHWILLGLGVLAAATFGAFREIADDAIFGFLQVARNLAAGRGVVANAGEPLLMPGIMTVMAYGLIGLLPLDLVAAAQWFNAAVGVLTTAGIYLVLAGQDQRMAGGLAAGLYATSAIALAVTSLGPDLALHNLLGVAAWWLWLGKRTMAAALVSGLLVIHRTDGVIQAAVMAWASWYRDRRAGRQYLVMTGALILAWLGLAAWYFGEPVTHWLWAHQLESELLQPGPLWRRYLLGFLPQFFWSPAGRWCLPFFLWGCWRVCTQHRFQLLRPLVWLLFLHPLAYEVATPGNLAVDSMHLVLVRPYYFMLCGVGMARAWEVGKRYASWGRGAYETAGVMALVILAIVRLALVADYVQMRQPGSREAVVAQRSAGEWLARHAAAGATVAADSLGIISFYAQRPFMDVAEGYVAGEVLAAMRDLRAQLSRVQVMDRLRPAYYVVALKYGPLLPEELHRYVEATRFGGYVVLRRRGPS
ncbi:MAG: hypothetical protein HY597_05075 [Candidatus Omnitrophica bacterium]|nr:hypothetical protein [Candidatus Omnitrophota bacterium]